jgi:hypothetical protein
MIMETISTYAIILIVIGVIYFIQIWCVLSMFYKKDFDTKKDFLISFIPYWWLVIGITWIITDFKDRYNQLK